MDKLGFDWGDESLYLPFQWQEVMIALHSVQMLKGHLDIHPDYVIPDADPWPFHVRGYPAGFYVNVLRLYKDVLFEHYFERYSFTA
ncbi:unnamed protein product [Discosporangium mesarthrocarpum]